MELLGTTVKTLSPSHKQDLKNRTELSRLKVLL